MIITFGSGHPYESGPCKGNQRSAMIILTCIPDKLHGNVRHVKESVGRHQSNCYYLFEFETNVVCSLKSKPFWTSEVVLACGLSVALFLLIMGLMFKIRKIDLPESVQSVFSKIRSACDRFTRIFLPKEDQSQNIGTSYNRFHSTATIAQINEEI